ncbi:MAG: tripartite tricarboxylate transporter TctB family protein [Thermodesulfobacteriota bacterium]
MKTQRSADKTSGISLAVLGVVVIVASYGITSPIADRLPPHTLPVVLGWTTLATGILLALRAWRSRSEGVVIEWPNREGLIRVVVNLVGLAVFIALITPLGMPLATWVYVTFSIWYLDRRIIRAVIIGFLSGATVFYVFVRFLELSFPLGPLQR